MAEQPPPLPHPSLPRRPLQPVERLPKRESGMPMCCSYQTSIEHIPVIIFDIKNDGRLHVHFKDVQDRRLSRVNASATLSYAGKPVTARRNPSNPPPLKEVGKEQAEGKKGGVSYHTKKGSLGAVVKLLPCDHEVTGSSPGNSLLQKCRERLRTIDPKWSDPSPDPAQAGATCTGLPFFSYHTIRLKNTLEPEDRGKMVDLLIDDQSQYCLGFRRGFEDDDGNEIWTGWFRAQGNFEWPSFLTAEELPIHGDHDVNVEIGGSDTLDDIFRGLWKYPDHRHDLVTLERAFLRAVIMFCETLRLFSIWLEVYLRVTEDSKATPLPGLHWRRIRNWKSSCTFVLETASKYHGLIRADIFWRRFHDFLGYESFDAIVTELRLLIWQDFLHDHGKGDVRRWLSRNQPGIEVENHVFPPSTVPEEPAEVQEV